MTRRLLLVAALTLTVAGLATAPAHATFPGPNGRIAFSDAAGAGQIYGVNPDGSGLTQLTHLGEGRGTGSLDWSPNGKHIVFGRFGAAAGRIWLMRADGSHPHRVAGDAPGFQDVGPKYTPDGRHIVFSRQKPDGYTAIWKMRTDGTHKRALTPYRNYTDIHLSISPGGRIAFGRYGAGGFTVRVFVMRADGSNPHPITPPRLLGGGPNWSPNGRRIAFSSNFVGCCRADYSIFTIKPDGSDIQRITPDGFPYGNSDPVYSPEGDQILFISNRNYPDSCCTDLFTIHPDGSDEQLLLIGLPGSHIQRAAWGTAPLLP